MNTSTLFTAILLCHFLSCHAAKHQYAPDYIEDEFDMSMVPDSKFHDFDYGRGELCTKLTVASPVLRYCSTKRVFYFHLPWLPVTILVLLPHTEGEFLVNITTHFRGSNSDIFVNDELLGTMSYSNEGGYRVLRMGRPTKGFNVTAVGKNYDKGVTTGLVSFHHELHRERSLGFNDDDHEWLYETLSGRKCYEVKVKMISGFTGRFCLYADDVGFLTEPYDNNTFFLPTTTTTPASDNPEDDSTHSEVHKASLLDGFIYAGCAVFVLIGTPLMSFLGYRTGRWLARRKALKIGLLKPDILMAAAPVDGFGSNALGEPKTLEKPPNTATT